MLAVVSQSCGSLLRVGGAVQTSAPYAQDVARRLMTQRLAAVTAAGRGAQRKRHEGTSHRALREDVKRYTATPGFCAAESACIICSEGVHHVEVCVQCLPLVTPCFPFLLLQISGRMKL